ncbi:MAG: hypothetical protein ACM3UU_09925 [Ignavibacteriales bacterium]
MEEENKDFILRYQIGIIRELHKQSLLSEEQMNRCIELLTPKNKIKEIAIIEEAANSF